MKSQHIVKLHNHFEDDFKVYLLLEYAPNGTLFDEFCKYHKKNSKIPLKKVAQYLKELLAAMKCM